MSGTEAALGARPGPEQRSRRLLGVFASWRLQAYGYTAAVLYAASGVYLEWQALWLVNRDGVPVYHDFTCAFTAGWLALHGMTASVYIPEAFARAQDGLVGAGKSLFSTWPYPPTYFLVLAPLAALPYI